MVVCSQGLSNLSVPYHSRWMVSYWYWTSSFYIVQILNMLSCITSCTETVRGQYWYGIQYQNSELCLQPSWPVECDEGFTHCSITSQGGDSFSPLIALYFHPTSFSPRKKGECAIHPKFLDDSSIFVFIFFCVDAKTLKYIIRHIELLTWK